MMKKLLILFLGMTALAGATVDFRGGKILCAELSKKAPAAMPQSDPVRFSEPPYNKIYAALTVNCDEGRSLSVLDYSINAGGRVYPCLAISKNRSRVQTNPEDKLSGKGKYTLFFILDANIVGLEPLENWALRANFVENKEFADQSVTFQNLGDKSFSSYIPDSGRMQVKK